MVLARRIILSIFILTYFWVCPLLILYSFGYIVNPVNKEIFQTGLIHLSTKPSEASIYLGKSRYKYKTPASISELLPGAYQVNLKLKGYRPWSHKVTIKAGQAAAFENILLIPERIKPHRIFQAASYSNLAPLLAKDSFFVQTGPRLEDYYFFDRQKENLRPLVNKNSLYSDFWVVSILAHQENMRLIVYGGSLWDRKYLLIDLENRGAAITDITKLFSDKPLAIMWSEENKNVVFAIYDDYVDRLDIESMFLYPKYIEDIKGFGLSGRWLYSLSKDRVISRLTLSKKQEAILFEKKHLDSDIFKKSRFYKIQTPDNDFFLFWGDRGDLIVSVLPYLISEKVIEGLEYYPQTKQLLYWAKDTIGITGFNRQNKKELLPLSLAQSQIVYKNGKNISQCFWAYNGAYIVFVDNDEVFLLELTPDEQHHVEYITNIKRKSSIFYCEEDGHLYYLDPQSNLMKTELVAKNYGF